MHGENFVYGKDMASDRMVQAIGTLERAIDRLEQDMEGLIRAATSSPSPGPDSGAGLLDASAARAALQSLDSLINELKGRTSG